MVRALQFPHRPKKGEQNGVSATVPQPKCSTQGGHWSPHTTQSSASSTQLSPRPPSCPQLRGKGSAILKRQDARHPRDFLKDCPEGKAQTTAQLGCPGSCGHHFSQQPWSLEDTTKGSAAENTFKLLSLVISPKSKSLTSHSFFSTNTY